MCWRFLHLYFFFFWDKHFNGKILKKLEIIKKTDEESFYDLELNFLGNIRRISLKKIKERYEKSFETKKILEEKAKTNVVIFTLLTTALSIFSSEFQDVSNFECTIWWLFKMMVVILMMSYMIFGAIKTFDVLMNKNVIYLVDDDIDSFSKRKQKSKYAKAIEINEYYNLLRNNRIFLGYLCIRNYLIFLLVYVFIKFIEVLSI